MKNASLENLLKHANLNIPAPKTGALHMGPERQNGDFLEKVSYDSD
jgi:hypothetical protein